MKLILLTLILFEVLAAQSISGGVMSGGSISVSGPSVFSFVQASSCTPAGSATSCNITLSQALSAGDVYAVVGDTYNALNQITSLVDGATTYTLGSGLSYAYGCSTGLGTQPPWPVCEYVLPANATGGTGTTLVLNFSAAPTNTPSLFYFIELKPNQNGAYVCLAGDQSQYNPTASTSQSGPSMTANGTGPWTIGSIIAPSNFVGASSVASPYSANTASNSWLFAAAAGSLAPAVYTMASSVTAIANSLVFAFNCPATLVQGFAINWNGATSGTALSAANIQTSTQGYQGAILISAGALATTFDSANPLTVLSSFGPLNDGSTLAAGTSTQWVTNTSDGSNIGGWTFSVQGTRTAQTNYYVTPLSYGIWLKIGDCSQNFNFDNAAIRTYGAADQLNQRTFANTGACSGDIETLGGGTGPCCVTYLANEPYWEDFNLAGQNNFAVTFTNGSAVIAATNTFSSGQWVNFSTTNALPTNFDAMKVYCVSATNLSGSQFSVSASCGGSLVTAGSAGTGTQSVVYPPSSIKSYNATAITGASCTGATTTLTTAGLPADGNVINGSQITLESQPASIWDGTFSSITVSGNNVSYSQTCPGTSHSGTASIVALVGTQWGPAVIGAKYFADVIFGMLETIPTGISIRHGYAKVSFTGLDPLLP